MMTTILTIPAKSSQYFFRKTRPIRYVWSLLFNRYPIKTETVGIKYVDDYRDRYEWIADNIPNFKKTVRVNCTVKTYMAAKPHYFNTISELHGEFRFKRQEDAVAFLMRWA